MTSRIRIDQVVAFSWKVLAPLAVLQLLVDHPHEGIPEHENRRLPARAPAPPLQEAGHGRLSLQEARGAPRTSAATPFLNPEMCIVCKACEQGLPGRGHRDHRRQPGREALQDGHPQRPLHPLRPVRRLLPDESQGHADGQPLRDRHGRPPQAENGLGLRPGRAQAQGGRSRRGPRRAVRDDRVVRDDRA
ncbi:MAG: NADH-quinone oxidoreductase subunit H [Desulfomicrobium escambiense]|nr:NADH-quinone oxidoreductase subunit H [Desulfomicrobium escambiense]